MRHPLKLSRPAGPRFHRLCFLCPVRPDNVRVALTLLTAIHFSSAFDVLTRQTACRSVLEQDRKDPASLMRVFASGATAGGVCALLQTPVRLTNLTKRRYVRLSPCQCTLPLTRQIEVVKCRAQVENQASSKALGSLGITKLIARQEGIKGEFAG